MKKNRILKKEFFITLFIKQNKWHKYGVLFHTFALVYHVLKNRHYDMLLAALLHDIGKPYVAFQDENDKLTNQYSFHNHEEVSYYIIRNWSVSSYTKKLVRYHYLIRGMEKAKQRKQNGKYYRQKRIFDKLDEEFKKKLAIFMKYDDKAKSSF